MDKAIEPKPLQVRIAIRLMWASMLFGIPVGFLNANPALTKTQLIFLATFMAVVFSILGLLICKTSQGRNWARLTLLILFVPSLWPYAKTLVMMFHRSALLGGLSVIQTLLHSVGLYLVFTRPGSQWFKRSRVSEQPVETNSDPSGG
jgi:hypothetical protein